MDADLRQGDSLTLLPLLEDSSIDSCVTDPPYGIGFMGKAWDRVGATFVERLPQKDNTWDQVGGNHHPVDSEDRARTRARENANYQAWCLVWAREVFRVLKPGGHLLAFGGTRTYHRLVCALEDAGFEVRDSIHWVYATGYPKSLDVSKAIDGRLLRGRSDSVGLKEANDLERGGEGRVRASTRNDGILGEDAGPRTIRDEPATPEAQAWEGWGTALKPAHEPIVVARKPLSGTVASNVLEHGTGGLNIDASRVSGANPSVDRRETARRTGHAPITGMSAQEAEDAGRMDRRGAPEVYMAARPGETLGRFPANLILSHAEGCRLLGTKKVPEARSWEKPGQPGWQGVGGKPWQRPRKNKGRQDTSQWRMPQCPGQDYSMEEVEEWECVPECPVRLLNEQSLTAGIRAAGAATAGRDRNADHVQRVAYGHGLGGRAFRYGDEGGVARFFVCLPWEPLIYCPKASRAERDAGLEHLPPRDTSLKYSGGEGFAGRTEVEPGVWVNTDKSQRQNPRNHHPTVKPVNLMRYLVRLVTPPQGVVLDPFLGSGTTAIAALAEGFAILGMERDPEYLNIARARVEHWMKHGYQPPPVPRGVKKQTSGQASLFDDFEDEPA